MRSPCSAVRRAAAAGAVALQAAALPLLLAALAGCSSDGSAAAPAPVTVSGEVTFDAVPSEPGTGLDYARTEARPARGVTVQAVQDGEVLAGTSTDGSGRYSLTLEPDAGNLRIRASAELVSEGPPEFDFRVVDNTDQGALYVLESALVVGSEDRTLDLHAASGWNESLARYNEPRAAAPFAILDVVRDASDVVLEAAPQIAFPPLVLHWSPENVPTRPEGAQPPFADGEIGSSLYAPGVGIFVLGAEDSDTDEYDRHVLAHEWAHYLEHALARSDSIGGPHTRGDQLDMRTAFSEGFANAFSAIVTGEPVYVDSLGPHQGAGFFFDIEGPFAPDSPNPNPGWFSEESVQEIVYDLYDAVQDTPEDSLALGLEPLLAVMTEDVAETPALTSIFAFAEALRARLPAAAPEIDRLLEAHSIGPFADAYGTGERNAGTPEDPAAVNDGDILPVYKETAVAAGPVNVCSTDAYNRGGEAGSRNKLGSRAFVRFSVSSPGAHRITATTTELPDDAVFADPDMRLFRRGALAGGLSESSPTEACTAGGAPQECFERFTRTLAAGDYVLEVYEWTNTRPPNGEYPPIGRTCFDVEVDPQ